MPTLWYLTLLNDTFICLYYFGLYNNNTIIYQLLLTSYYIVGAHDVHRAYMDDLYMLATDPDLGKTT